MRVLQVEVPGKLVVVERETPQPGPGEVRLRTTAVGICGTDLHVYGGLFDSYPIVPGHDASGVIEAVGPGVPDTRVRERVTVDPAACCTRAATSRDPCPACARGATHLCAEATYMGMTAEGAMAEQLVVPAARAVTLPTEVDDHASTVLEPIVVGLHLLEQIEDRPGPVLVLGGGPIGIASAILLQDEGREVLLSEPLFSRRQKALELGAREVVEPTAIPKRDFRVIVETSGHPSSVESIQEHARPGSTVVIVGGPTDIPALVILLRELEVRAAKGGRGLYPEAIARVVAGTIDPASFITHAFPAREAETAFETTRHEPERIFRAVLDMTDW
jgi:2-desacetyl-2-hydroxyethyl bacteriochlorophyllide A dehydrogenase